MSSYLVPPLPPNGIGTDALSSYTTPSIDGSGIPPLPSGLPTLSDTGVAGTSGATGTAGTTSATTAPASGTATGACAWYNISCWGTSVLGRVGAVILGLVLIAGALYLFANSQNLIPKGVPIE